MRSHIHVCSNSKLQLLIMIDVLTSRKRGKLPHNGEQAVESDAYHLQTRNFASVPARRYFSFKLLHERTLLLLVCAVHVLVFVCSDEAALIAAR